MGVVTSEILKTTPFEYSGRATRFDKTVQWPNVAEL